MALFILYGKHPSSSPRICMLSLTILILVCSFSYCCSSPASSFDSSSVDVGNDVDNINDSKDFGDESNSYHRLPFRPASSTIDYSDTNEDQILTNDHFLDLLLKSVRTQEEDHPYRQHSVRVSNKRYVPQTPFHAMRG